MVYKIELFDKNYKQIAKTYATDYTKKRWNKGLDGIIQYAMAHKGVSGTAKYFRMYFGLAKQYEYCGTI